MNRAIILKEAKRSRRTPVEISLGIATGCLDCARHDIDDGISAKTDQILELSPKIAVNADVAGEHKLIVNLKSHRCLLLARSGIDCSQIQIQTIKSRIGLRRLPFFENLSIQLLHQQHCRPPRQDVASGEL